ncbi:MAG: hypothetical protein NVSMB62_26460 [Acidobacteriaceae bacterium]
MESFPESKAKLNTESEAAAYLASRFVIGVPNAATVDWIQSSKNRSVRLGGNMDSTTIKKHLSDDIHQLRADMAQDLKAKVAHVTDPSQCGYVVRRHFNMLLGLLLLFVALFIGAAGFAIYLYIHR